MKILDIGCGDRKEFWEPGSDGIDIFDYGQKYIFDIEETVSAGWLSVRNDLGYKPITSGWHHINDNSYDKVKAQHILEHIRNPVSFINILNQIWRVARPGGLFVGEAPHFTSPNFFRDPFHCRQISENTFDAFLEGSAIHFGTGYNVQCKFRPVGRGIFVNSNRDVVWTLEVVK